jgi:hypothetical protein
MIIERGMFPVVNGLEVYVMPSPKTARFFVLCSDADAGKAIDGFRSFITNPRGGTGLGADGERYGAPGARIEKVVVHKDTPEGIVLVLPKRIALDQGPKFGAVMAEVQALSAIRNNGNLSGKSA